MRYLLVFTVLLVSCGHNKDSAVSVAEFSEFIKAEECLLIDVRSAEEYVQGHIVGSATIDFYSPEFESKFMFIKPNQKMALYCNTGNRSGQAIYLLKDLGYTDIVQLNGGLNAWEDEGYEIVEE